MSALTDFLFARIADDHATANGIELEDHLVPPNMNGLYWGNGPYAEVHVTKERLLAECTAKREIVHYLAIDADEEPAGQGTKSAADLAEGATQVLRLLAMPYAGHPDSDEAWRLP